MLEQKNDSLHILMRKLHSVGGIAHSVQYLGVSIGALKRFTLRLNLCERSIDLCQLLLVALLALQSGDGRWKEEKRGGLVKFIHRGYIHVPSWFWL